MISKNSIISSEENLSFEKLSSLLNDLSIMTHPISKAQKVCIEYPNITIENENINIFSEKNNNTENKPLNDEYTLNLSQNKKKYVVNPQKLFDEFNKSIPYSFEEFKNSLKIFISIFNCFNEDIFKWDLSDFNLFNDKNMVQILEINLGNKNKIYSESFMKDLYKKHFSVKYDLQKSEIIEVFLNNKENENNKLDDFENDDFDKDSSKKIKINKSNENSELYCYEKDNVFRNLFFLMSLFNLMNKFNLGEYSLDNILKNFSKFNSYIINDYKVLLLIYFNLAIQINLFIKQSTVDNFLNIKTSEIIDNKNNSKDRMVNNYFPNIYFLDYQEKEITKDENELKKEKIILFNIILKLFILNYLSKTNTNLKINIKIFNISYFSDIKSKLIIEENYFYDSNNINFILDSLQNQKIVELFSNDLNKYFSIVIFEFILLPEINIITLYNLVEIYYPILINSDFVSFDTLENDSMVKYPLNNYLNEITILSWSLKYILKIVRSSKKLKFAFTFVFNSFNIALKKDVNNKMNINIEDLMIYMGIYHYDENEMVKYIGEENNYQALYKKFKEILKCCGEYKNYNINIRLFKNGIINKELQYHFISLILNILNNIKIKNKDFYKNISLYESKFINTIKCIFIHIKKKNKDDLKLNKIKSENKIAENNIEFNHKENAIVSPKKKRNKNKNNNFLGKFTLFKNKKNDEIVHNLNNINVFPSENLFRNDSNYKNISRKFNNFYKNLSNCSFLSKLESDTLIDFFKSIKNYFTDFMFYIEKINLQNNKAKENNFIFENTFDSSLSFDPINILRNFNNNKCFIILKDFSYIELYIYLYDFYQNNIEEDEDVQKTKEEIYNEIFNNINILKEKCYNNFKDQKNTKSSLVIVKINFILHKYFLILNHYFEGNKIFFNNENKIIFLDKFTNTDCILDNGHIDIILNNCNSWENDDEKNKEEKKEDGYLIKFYSAFLYEYDIIKHIVEKKLFKVNKLNIIIKRKILQINNGKIQLKKINLKKNKKLNEENINNNSNSTSVNSTPTKKEQNINNIINENSNNKSNIVYENYNLFKIRELFRYNNSFPLIIFFLENETEISNFSFLLFAFAEIFLNKLSQELTKELLIKRIIQFFYRFKDAEFIPIIFNKKYFNRFLDFFEVLISKFQKKNSKENNESPLSSKKSLININKHIFSNIIFYPLNIMDKSDSNEINNFLNKDIFYNLTKKISLYQIGSKEGINYNLNQIGKMFKLKRIKGTLSEIEKIVSNAVAFEGNNDIIIYRININNLKMLIKRNLKKVKFKGINEENKTFNVHIFNSEDNLKKFRLENINNDNENCLIF